MRKYTVVVIAAVALLIAAPAVLNLTPALKASESQAQTVSPIAITDAQESAAVSVKHTALNSVIDHGEGGGTLGPVHTPIDITTIVCPSTATKGCTVGFESMVQVGGNSASTKNPWAICHKVDDVFTKPTCPIQGILPSDGSYVTGTSLQNLTVGIGTHTVTTDVWLGYYGATLGTWQSVYVTYKP
jgi:hypothetical protein